MDFLLDTNQLLWSQLSPGKVSDSVLRVIEDPYNNIYFSTISIWEIAIKFSNRKLELGGRTPEKFLDALEDAAMLISLELSPGIVARSHQLPFRHRDPFDRMLIWEALEHDMTLLSSDKSFESYRSEGLRLIY